MLFAPILFIIGILFWYRYESRQQIVNNLSELEQLLESYDFKMYRPAIERSWGVGTVFRIVEGKPFWDKKGEEVLGNLATESDRTVIPDLIINGTFAAEGTAVVKSLATTDLSLDKNIKVKIKFHNPVVFSIGGSKLKERLEKTSLLRKSSQRSGFFVITEALRVDQIEFILESGDKTAVGIEIPKNDAKKLADAKFDIQASNRFSTKFPLYVGYKAHKLETIAGSLGEVGTIQLHPLSPKEFRQIQEQSLSLPLETDFQIYGLLIGLGNYYSSKYVGGSLPGAKNSVETVARHIRRLPGSEVEELVHVYSSLTNPEVSKEMIMDKIDEFIKKYSHKMNDKSLLIFYYFGHGLSEPKSRMALLIPEVGYSIFVSELVDKLKELPGDLLILIDACRERQRSEELPVEKIIFKELSPLLPPGIGKALTMWADTMWASGTDLISFPNFFTGPDPIIFSSPDRGEAKTVPYVLPDGYISNIGPLARRFDEIWHSALGHEEPLKFEGLVQGLLEPGQDGVPSGYAAWKGELELPKKVFVQVK